METKTETITHSELTSAGLLVTNFIRENSIEEAEIVYFFTLREGEPAHTFKVTYQAKTA